MEDIIFFCLICFQSICQRGFSWLSGDILTLNRIPCVKSFSKNQMIVAFMIWFGYKPDFLFVVITFENNFLGIFKISVEKQKNKTKQNKTKTNKQTNKQTHKQTNKRNKKLNKK